MIQTSTVFNLYVSTLKFQEACRQAGLAMSKFASTAMRAYAPLKAGNWPDRYILLNRYMRTNLLPDYFSEERWEI